MEKNIKQPIINKCMKLKCDSPAVIRDSFCFDHLSEWINEQYIKHEECYVSDDKMKHWIKKEKAVIEQRKKSKGKGKKLGIRELWKELEQKELYINCGSFEHFPKDIIVTNKSEMPLIADCWSESTYTFFIDIEPAKKYDADLLIDMNKCDCKMSIYDWSIKPVTKIFVFSWHISDLSKYVSYKKTNQII